eukprot:2336911-Pleurochrysis_carterae.AAC.2
MQSGSDNHSDGGQLSPRLRSVYATCTRYRDGDTCRGDVVYTAPHYCERCLRTGMMGGMRMTRPRLHTHVRVTVEPWQHKVGNEARKKLSRMKQA